MASFSRFAPLALALPALVALAPEPDPIPRRWQLTVEPGPLRVASVELPGQGHRAFYYMTYKVVNTTDTDLLFTPAFDLGTSDGDLLRSGRDVPPAVTRDILARLASPFLQDQTSIVGVLLQGEANAKEGVVVWPIPDMNPSEVTIYGAGFSGEAKAVEFKDEKGQPAKVLLRKTLMLRYQTPGEIRHMGAEPLPLIEQQWIMR